MDNAQRGLTLALFFVALGVLASPMYAQCVGDCNGDGSVTVNELITGVNIALGNKDVSACEVIDADGDGSCGINELILAVNNALNECPPFPTATATPTQKPSLRIVHFQVDQGDATLVVSAQGKAILIDSGKYRRHATRITNYLDEHDVELAYTIVTHYDADHIGALDLVIAGPDGEPGLAGVDDDGDGEVDERSESGEYGAAGSDDLQPTGLAIDRGDDDRGSTDAIKEYLAAVAGKRLVAPATETLEDTLFEQRFDLGDGALKVRVVAANGTLPDGTLVHSLDENARSLAVLIELGGFDYLIAGDLTGGGDGKADVETKLGEFLQAKNIDVFHADHHGSKTSNNSDFLQKIKPEVVIISVGNSASCGAGFNQYGHPAQETLDALHTIFPATLTKIYQTNEGGARPVSSSDCQPRTGEAPRDYWGIPTVFASDDVIIDTDGITYTVSWTDTEDSYQVDD